MLATFRRITKETKIIKSTLGHFFLLFLFLKITTTTAIKSDGIIKTFPKKEVIDEVNSYGLGDIYINTGGGPISPLAFPVKKKERRCIKKNALTLFIIFLFFLSFLILSYVNLSLSFHIKPWCTHSCDQVPINSSSCSRNRPQNACCFL